MSSGERAHALNPASSDATRDMAEVHFVRGRPAEAMEWLDWLNEVQPIRSVREHTLRGEALYLLRRFGEAADKLLRVRGQSNRRRAFRAAVREQAGREAAAVEQLRILSRNDPGFDYVASLAHGDRYENPADAEHVDAGMRRGLSLPWRT